MNTNQLSLAEYVKLQQQHREAELAALRERCRQYAIDNKANAWKRQLGYFVENVGMALTVAAYVAFCYCLLRP